jgi:peptidoglycan/LPS O-acetylase OafA/YrhL
MSGLKSGEFRSDINGLRGLSVLMVVLYHFNLSEFEGGFIGVDVFFVISGYLMTKIIYSAMTRGDFSYVSFMISRAARIFPALFAVIVLLLGIGYWILPPSDLHSLGSQALQAVLFNSNSYYASQQDYFSTGLDDRWLLHTWSLSVEWQFYLLYPALLALGFLPGTASKPALRRSRVIAILSLAGLCSILYCLTLESQQAFFSVFARAWQMIAGGLACMLVEARNGNLLYRRTLGYLGVGIIVLSAVLAKLYHLQYSWPGYASLMPVGGTCLALFARDEKNIVLSNPISQWIGKWSYSIYLVHMPIYVALSISGLIGSNPKLYKMVGVMASIVLGFILYKLIESARIKNPRSLAHSIKIAGPAAVIAGFAYAAVLSAGFAQRFDDPEIAKNIALAETSHSSGSECRNDGLVNDRVCVINPEGRKKILIIGDSVADHLYPWFAGHSKVNTTFYVKPGCPVIEGFERSGPDRHCREFSERAFKMAASGTYQTVIISQNWAGFSKSSNGICIFSHGKCVPLNVSADPMAAAKQMKSSIQGLLDKDIQVAVLESTPWFLNRVPKKVERDIFWHGKTGEDLSAKTALMSESADYDSMFKAFVKDPRFTLLSLRKKLCPEQGCRIYDEQMKAPIFKDQNHFNPAWIEKHGDVFEAVAR